MKKNEEKKAEADRHIARIGSQFLFSYFKPILFAAVLLILAGGFFLVLKPKYDDIQSSIKASNDSIEEQIDILAENKDILNDYRNSFNKLSEANKDRLDRFLPLEFDRDLLFAEMEALIVGQGYVLDSIRLSDMSQSADASREARGRVPAKAAAIEIPAGVGAYEMNLEISGLDYSGIKNLLAVFEQSLRLYDVVGLNFSEGGGSVSLKIYTYYLL